MPGTSYTPADFMDLTAQYGDPNRRVCYIDPPVIGWVNTLFDNLAARAPMSLATIPYVAQAPFPLSWLQAMEMNDAQIADLYSQYCNYVYSPYVVPRETALASGPLASSLGLLLNDDNFMQAGFADAKGAALVRLDGCVSDAAPPEMPPREPLDTASVPPHYIPPPSDAPYEPAPGDSAALNDVYKDTHDYDYDYDYPYP